MRATDRIFFPPAFHHRKAACALADALLITGTFLLAIAIRFESVTGVGSFERLYVKLAAVTSILLLCAYYNRLYREHLSGGR